MLGEHSAHPTRAALLWQSLQDVLLWARTEPHGRPGLFSSAAAERRAEMLERAEFTEARELAGLVLLSTLLNRDGGPSSVDDQDIGHACGIVAGWAKRGGYPETALAFTQAAAQVTPRCARSAYEIGSLARRHGRHQRAITWLSRGIGVARRAKDWKTYAECARELGLTFEERGELPRARAALSLAGRTCRRYAQTGLRGPVYVDLLRVGLEMGEDPRALEHLARRALQHLPRDSPAHAEVWLGRARLRLRIGRPALAEEAAAMVLRFPVPDPVRVRALALRAFASALAGAPLDALGARWLEAWEALAGTRLDSATAAAAAGDLLAAAEHADHAASAARARTFLDQLGASHGN